MRIYEIRDTKGPITNISPYEKLYHLTDANGFGYSIEKNSLQTLRYDYVSTTHSPNMNKFVGGDFHFFKFILDGKKLAQDYGIFPFQFYTNQGEALEEFEIGINTKMIQPLREYLKGVVLIFPKGLFSYQALIWLTRYHLERKSGFLSSATSSAKPAIRTLAKLFQWNVPIWNQKEGQTFSAKEIELLKDILNCYKRKTSEDDCIEFLLGKYNIEDYFGKKYTRQRFVQEKMGPRITKMFNDYFSGRKYNNVDSDIVKKIVEDSLNLLDIGKSKTSYFLNLAEKYNLFHPVIAPVEWSILFREIIEENQKNWEDTFKFISDRNKTAMKRFDEKNDDMQPIHSGTSFFGG